jgi:ATP-dependent DNA helicase RecG
MKETQHTEWKESWRDEYLRWICGFANAEGGVLIIGRDDRGKVVGVKDASKLLREIPNKVRDILGIMVDVNLVEEAGKETLEIVVEPYPSPVSYKGEYHYRSGSTKQELKGAALDRFLLRKLGRHWDGVPVPYVTLADLDATVLRRFREQAVVSRRLSSTIFRESDAQLLDKLRLIEGRYLKRAAVLLFHPDPERFVTGAFIKIGYFRTNSELLFHDTIHGDLFLQIDKTMDLLLTKYLKAMISYEGVQRVETYPVPEEALREALLNAVIHKDYSSGVPIQISVYEDKILFWNNGELYEGWTVDTLLQKHSSQPFNPDVAHTFFRAGMIEAWGRGIERMIDACKDAGVPVPILRYEIPGLWVEFLIRMVQRPDKIGVGTTQKTTQKIPQKILAILVENPAASRREIAERLADITEDGVKYHLDRLKAAGKIRHIGPARGGHWEVRIDDYE